jgi:GAF domain-containing protein
MAKTKRKAGKRTTADRAGSRARKSGVSKARKPGLRKPKPAKTDPRKRKPSFQPEIARLKRQLKAARMQREASAEILRAVANASGDAAGPLQLIAETTAGLFKASSVSIQLAEGSEFTQEYRVGAIAKRVGSAYPRSNIKVGGRNLPGTVVAENRQIHIPDLDQLDPSMSDFPGLPHARAGGARTVCGTPLRRDGKAIGALIMFRDRLLPFTGDELALLQSFADQAVIAIHNARLFNDVEAKTRDLTEALLRQTATADVLKIVSRSVSHAAPVFETIIESCQRLFDPFDAAIYIVDGEMVKGVARRGSGNGDWGTDSIPLAGSSTGLAIAQRRPLHFPDLADKADLPEDKRDAVRLAGGMSVLYAPIISESRGVGSLVVTRRPKKPFTETEVEVIQSFADQAAVAIENARLFNETKAALEQQTATAEILSVMSSSPTDVTPVFEAIAERARELSGSRIGSAVRFDGELLHMIAFRGSSPEAEAAMHAAFPMKPGNGSLNARVIAGLVPLQIPDIDLDPAYQLGDVAKKGDYRALLAVPMIHDGRAIGAIGIGRDEPGPFPEKIVALLQTFASQAVIAIENVRLFNETREALEQQTATSEVLAVISRSPSDLNPVLQAISDTAARLCGSEQTMFFRYDGNVFRILASWNFPPEVHEMLERRPLMPGHPSAIGRAGASLKPVCIPDVLADPDYGLTGEQSRARYRATLAVPLLREGRLIGALSLNRSEPGAFTGKQIELVATFADQAVIAIENTRLFNETREALAYQTGSSNVLRVIASSPTDVEPVLKEIVESARELCEANDAVVLLRDAEHLRFSAHSGPIAVALDKWPISRNWTAGRAFVDQKPVHVHDMLSGDGAEFPDARAMGQSTGSTIHTVLSVPLLRGNESIGAILLRRTEVRPFNEKQINLLATFADQAVIAIQNTRLFNEIKEKTRDLTEALTYQTGSASILNVIAASPTDVAPVLKAIVESACGVCEAYDAAVLLRDGDDLRFSAHHGPIPIGLEKWPINRRWTAGRAFIDQRPVHIEDLREDRHADFSDGRDLSVRMGHRTILSVPLLRDKESIGAIVLRRIEVHPFSDKQIALLQTFGDQAVIALGNVRLFEEVQAKTRELEQSLDDLRTAQDRLVQTEKLASLGQLTAGIAHEIKNPLNFVNNFAALSAELIDEMTDVFDSPTLDEAGRRKELDEIRELLKSNLEKVVQHGKRADSIVKNMLLHSREGSGEQRAVDINALLDESLNLAYHGARAEKPGFNITLQRDLDPDAGVIELFPQEITRALLNLISNGFYAASKREAENGELDFEPVLRATTRNLGNHIEIRIRDNGTGIPPDVREKMFNPFFTTKPAGEGTGLGLSMSHDIIVKQHGGRIELDTQPGQFTEFTIVLPRASTPADNRND